MRTEPEDYIDAVQDEASFILFLKILGADKEAEDTIEKSEPSSPYNAGALGWENQDISTFLEAASCCGRDHLKAGGIAQGKNPWRVCAEILLGGKYYE